MSPLKEITGGAPAAEGLSRQAGTDMVQGITLGSRSWQGVHRPQGADRRRRRQRQNNDAKSSSSISAAAKQNIDLFAVIYKSQSAGGQRHHDDDPGAKTVNSIEGIASEMSGSSSA
ncbi:MAG: hypothetical protein WKG01_38760 [Kofleriaceae bacterium]